MSSNVMIVTPAYCTEENNRLPLLLQSIYWIKQQTHKYLDHIIVNDGSTDETPEILENIAHHNPNIKVYHKSNGGSSSAVNFGIEKAILDKNYDFVTITHSDDILTKNSIEDRGNSLTSQNSKMCYSDMLVFNELTGYIRRNSAREFCDNESLYNSLKNHENITYPTIFWDLDFFINHVGGYDERITSSEDWDITLKTVKELLTLGQKHSITHDITAAYRIHQNNLGYTNIRDGTKWKCYKLILKKHMQDKNYKIALAKESVKILRALIPETIKTPLRYLRDTILSNPPNILPFRSEFIESLNQIDYRSEILK